MQQATAVLLLAGNAILFWLWVNQVLPLLRELLRSGQGKCPHCGGEKAAEAVGRRRPA